MDPTRLSQRTRDALARLPADKQRRAVEIIARTQTPEARERDAADRETLDHEYQETGRIATLGEESGPEESRRIKALVEQLRRTRIEAGLSLDELARRSNLEKSVLSRIEEGTQVNPALGTLYRYARGLGLELDVSFHPISEVPG